MHICWVYKEEYMVDMWYYMVVTSSSYLQKAEWDDDDNESYDDYIQWLYCFISSGPYGVNHGVELHADVLKYSLERLEEFKKNSPAIDAFNFCDPQFVQGRRNLVVVLYILSMFSEFRSFKVWGTFPFFLFMFICSLRLDLCILLVW